MLAALSNHGWNNYSIFMNEEGLLFGYVETEKDLETSLSAMEKEHINQLCQEMMSPFFEIPPGAKPDQMLIELEEVFHLD